MEKAQTKHKNSRKNQTNPVNKIRPLITKTEDLPVTMGYFFKLRELFELVASATKKQFDSHESRFKSVEKHFEYMQKRFEYIDKRFISIDKRLESIDKGISAMNKKNRSRPQSYVSRHSMD